MVTAASDSREVVRRATALCHARGFDLVQPFRVGAYNALVPEPELRLPDFSRETSLGLVVGNSRALWPVFRAALASDPTLAAEPDPLDCYTTRTVETVLTALGVDAVARFAHVLDPYPLPIQRVARASGLAWLSPSHLSIHAAHGPWIGLRAVIVADVAGPADAASAPDPCTPCEKPCLPALHEALARTRGALAMDPERHDWRAWLAVRDACPVGRAARYSDDQIEYHYTKLAALLRR